MFKKASFALVIIGLLSGCGIIKSKLAEDLTDITYFSYGYTSGTYDYSGCNYTARLEDEVVTVTVRPDGSQETYTFETDADFMNEITKIANKYGVSSWDGFDQSKSNVFDGDSFSFSLQSDSNQSVSARGYMSYPVNYAKATNEFEALFIELYESYYPNKSKILQNYLDEVLITEYGLSGNDQGKVEVSYPYLAAAGANGENNYFTRGNPELNEGVIGYVIKDLFNTGYQSDPDTDYYMIVYRINQVDDCWKLSFEYYTVDDFNEVKKLGEEVIDDNLFDNDGIYANLGRISNGEQLLVYSGDQKSIAGDGSKTYFLSIYKLEPDGCELADHDLITISANQEDWSVDLIEPFMTIAKKYSLDEEMKDWEGKNYDPVLNLYSKDVSVFTSQNKTSGFNQAITNTKTGEAVEDYQVDGSITAVRYGYSS